MDCKGVGGGEKKWPVGGR